MQVKAWAYSEIEKKPETPFILRPNEGPRIVLDEKILKEMSKSFSNFLEKIRTSSA